MPTTTAPAWTPRDCALLACCLACSGMPPAAWAETDGADAGAASGTFTPLPDSETRVPAGRPVAFEVAVRPAALDGDGTSLRLDVTRWIHASGSSHLGLLLSTPVPQAAQARPVGLAMAPWGADVGVRWRTALRPGQHLDLSAWTRAAAPGQPPDALGMIWSRGQASDYGARLEVQWRSSPTGGIVPEFGAIGVQLEGQSRLLLRARRGGPMLYYRTKF